MATLNINLLYDTQVLLGAITKLALPTRFWRDNFFPKVKFSVDEYVELDFQKVGRAVAPKIRRQGAVPVMSRPDFDTQIYKAPETGGSRVLDTDTILKRWLAENPYTDKSPAERAGEIIKTDLLQLDSFIARTEELDALNCLLTGGAYDANGNFQSYGTLNTFTPAILWGGATPTILADLWAMYKLVGKNSLIWPDTLVLSQTIFEALRGDTSVQNVFRAFNQYEGLMGTIKPDRLSDNVYYAGLITAPRLAVYVYIDYYLDSNGVNQPMWPESNLFMGSSKGNGHFLYGAISQIEDVNTGEFVTYSESTRVPQVVSDKDKNIRTLKLRSRFLPAHPDITEYVISKVV